MSRYTPHYHLPDLGFTLIHWAHDYGQGRAAMIIDPAIERLRRTDGAFAYNDLTDYTSLEDGPGFILRELLDLESQAIQHWAHPGFPRFHKRSNARHAYELCRAHGSEQAVEWVYAHAPYPPEIEQLRALLGPPLYTLAGKNEQYYRNQIKLIISSPHRRP